METIYLCLSIIIIYILVLIYYLYYSKKIVSVYETESYFGLGDYIRGIIHLYQEQSKHNYDVFVNYDNHDISKFVYNEFGNHSSFIKSKIIKTDQLNFNKLDKKTFIYHNAPITYPIDENILKKVRRMFTPKPEFQKLIDQKISEIGEKFIVIHIRLKDDVFKVDRILNDSKIDDYIKTIKAMSKILSRNIVIMSNSNKTKQSFSDRHGLRYIKVNPAHTGAIGVKADISDTMLEFYIMSKALEIHQYCEDKNQVSGFSQRISEIYDINLFKIE